MAKLTLISFGYFFDLLMTISRWDRYIQQLSSCAFIDQKLIIVISGKTGSGKTYISCALGSSACRHGFTVKYYRIPELLLEIQDAKNENQYAKFMSGIQNIKLLILDDIGLKSYSLI